MRPGRLRFLAAAALILLGAGCRDEPTAPVLPDLEVVPTVGEGAFGVVGQEVRLEAVVRRRSDGTPRSDVEVSWTVERGDAALLPGSDAGRVSDARGVVWTRIRLGDIPGSVEVRVTVREQVGATALFTATVGDHPRLDSVTPAVVAPGESVALEGAGFSPRPEDDVVLFSGIRARVLSADPERMEVEVPPCLPARTLEVTVQLGDLVSEAVPVTMTSSGGEELALEPGRWLNVTDPAGPGCLRLTAGGRYLVLASSASTVAGARYPLTLRGLSSRPPAGAVSVGPLAAFRTSPSPSFAARWEDGLRAREAGLTRRGPSARGPRGAPAAGPASVPTVGDRRSFRVLNVDGEMEEVTAVARHVGTRAVVYMDETAPEGGFTDADLAGLADRFDEAIHPTVTRVFGAASDLDANGRIIVLFTPVVNRLSPRGSDGFVGGFFYGLDLLEGEGGNDGEIFYALVPDPDGVHSEPRSTDKVRAAVPAVLAHEFQHMVHFNQRVLLRGGTGTGALWLSEGLAQMAEELVARHFRDVGQPQLVEEFRRGNLLRGRRYLEDPAATSLVVASGQGTLTERGGGWLFTLYLEDRWGESVLGELTRTTRTGVENVTAATGVGWGELLGDWWSALYLDGQGPPGEYEFDYPSVALRSLLGRPGEDWPLKPIRVGDADFLRADTLWSTSVRHYLAAPPDDASMVLRLAGGAGAGAAAGSELGLRIVRLF